MTFSIELPDDTNNFLQLQDDASNEFQAKIKVVGVGGGGGNAVNAMINYGLEGVEFIVVNTDAQALNVNAAPIRVAIGQNITRGLGAGGVPEKGRKAALEDVASLKDYLSGADMVFVTAGMGGGTGTGAAPIVAQIAREEGALCVGVVTKPFNFEGPIRAANAEVGLAALAEHVDTIITIPNQKLTTMEKDFKMVDAFQKVDGVLYQAVSGITEVIRSIGTVNLDFADIKTIMSGGGRGIMGTGCAKGDGKARLAAEMAVTSPLLDDISLRGATKVLVNFVVSSEISISEIEEAMTYISEQVDGNANVIFGHVFDESMGDMVKVTVIATGFDASPEQEDVEQQSQQSVPVALPQQVATSRVSTQPPASRTTLISEDSGLLRRRSAASATHSQVTVTPAARTMGSSFPAASEMDWDIPAYTRRTGK